MLVAGPGGRGGAKTVKRPPQPSAQLRYANYWAPLTRKRHIPPHSAQPRHTKYWAPRTRKRHQPEHQPQRPTERSDPTQHAKGRTGDCPGPRKGATTRRNVTWGGGGGGRGDWGQCVAAYLPPGRSSSNGLRPIRPMCCTEGPPRPVPSPEPANRLATSICQLRHDQMEQAPTEPHTTHWTQHVPTEFWWCGGRVLLSGLRYGADCG